MNNNALKEALIESLEGTLSPDASVRKTAEEKLKALEATDNFGSDLLDVVLEVSYVPPIRQLASVLLRQYIDVHWTNLSDKYMPPEPSTDLKNHIKSVAPFALREQNSKIRNCMASVISKIAHWDWPEEWPNLFQVVMDYLQNPESVSGAMRVLAELVKELTCDHVIQVLPIVLPEMLRILNDKVNYSVETRIKAVEVFRTILRTIPSNVEKYLASYLEPFLQGFVASLEEKDPQFQSFALQKTIVKAITLLIHQCPKKISPYLGFILKPIWNVLTSYTQEFQVYLSGEDDDSAVDSDGEQCGIEGAVFSVFALIQLLLEKSSMKSLVKTGLSELIFYVIFYMQLPQERIESWISSPASFAIDEDEDNATYTLRVCAQDLLVAVSDEFPDDCYPALGQAVERHLSNSSDWRLQEACLFAVCTLGTKIVKPKGNKEDKEYFNIHGFIQNVVFPGLNSSDTLLAGRCLVLGSHFCTVLTPEVTRQFVEAAVQAIVDPQRSIVSKILAIKAINSFVDQAKENLTVKMALLEFLPGSVDALVSFVATQTVEISTECLQTITDILALDENFTASCGHKVITLVIACFVKFNGDPVVCPILEDTVRILCKNSNCVIPLQERFTPTLVSVLNVENPEMGGIQATALDMLAVIVRASPLPLSTIIMREAFPAVVNRVFVTDDHTVLQNGGECMRAFTVASPQQVYEYRDSQGISGLGHVVKMACRLLDPSTSEFSASFVGRLVTSLITRAGDKLGDQLELLLRAVLSKLQSADTLSVIQNLCMVYAHLFNTQMDATLNFLDSVPGPTGQSALHFVMTEWVSRQQMFFGVFERKVSILALSKILQLGVTQNDRRLSQIQVKGDPIIDPNSVRALRSRSAGQSEQWTVIPLLVKIFKLLINELSSFVYEEYESEDDSEDSEDENEDKENSKELFVGDELYQEDEIDDPEILNDPINALDLEKFLKEYLKEFSSHVYFAEFVKHLTPLETKVLNTSAVVSI